MMDDIQQTVRRLVDASAASTVSVGRNGRGTGFVVATDRVVTCAHNLRDRTVLVTFADGRAAQGSVHAADPDGDLVVLDVATAGSAPLDFADTVPDIGAAVVVLARGGHRARATVGFVSALDQAFQGPRGRAVRGGIEHTAPLARGSSGSPVFDTSGRVVGINTHRAGDGFYLARAADLALQSRIRDLVAGRSTTRRTLGVAVAPPEVGARLREAVGLPARPGLLVRGVEDASPASRAGVQVGDLLVTLGGRELATVDALTDALQQLDSDTVELGVVRGTEDSLRTVSFSDSAGAGDDGRDTEAAETPI